MVTFPAVPKLLATTFLLAACSEASDFEADAGTEGHETSSLEPSSDAWSDLDAGMAELGGRVTRLEAIEGHLHVDAEVGDAVLELWPDARAHRLILDGSRETWVALVESQTGQSLLTLAVAKAPEHHDLVFGFGSSPAESDWLDAGLADGPWAEGEIDGTTHRLDALLVDGEVVSASGQGAFGETAVARLYALGIVLDDIAPVLEHLRDLPTPIAMDPGALCRSARLSAGMGTLGHVAACCGASEGPACLSCVNSLLPGAALDDDC